TDENQEFVTIKCVGQSRPIVFESSRVEAAQKRIIEKYNVIKDHYLGEEKKAPEEQEEQEEAPTPDVEKKAEKAAVIETKIEGRSAASTAAEATEKAE
ncbi:MAG: hypothetical protein GY953_21910, partial [bacterium]|nr:hypothetical protein [bacterium]